MAVELVASIYYHNDASDPSKAFERAARTEIQNLDPAFLREFVGVTTRAEFLSAWGGIPQQAINNGATVAGVYIVTHASKQNDEEDGLEFADSPDGSTLTRADIEAMSVLPWSQSGWPAVVLHGCNTGVLGDRGWCPAEAFARTQGVVAFGEAGFAYFSNTPDTYSEISDTDSNVYLFAYNRGRNAPTGDGARIPGNQFHPTGFAPFLAYLLRYKPIAMTPSGKRRRSS
jgi:hypothetical protein